MDDVDTMNEVFDMLFYEEVGGFHIILYLRKTKDKLVLLNNRLI